MKPDQPLPRRARCTRLATLLAPALALVTWLLSAPPLAAQERLTFIGVALDRETRDADRRLHDYLYRTAGVSFAPENLEYGRVVDRLIGWRPSEGPFLARTTPFVYVAAEMLGAELELLATYVSEKTGSRIYHSYLVVRRADFPEEPTPEEVIRFLAGSGRRPRFVYHNRFSTSSFFLPSLFLRSHHVYHMEQSTESLIAIGSRRIEENSSSRLVELVARGDAEIAAVWDGTVAAFAPEGAPGWQEFGRHVHFVRLPTALPNDLLVCWSGLDDAVKERLRAAIAGMGEREIGLGDFRTWQSIRDAADARAALADLRWLARERLAPITVEIRLGGISSTTRGSTTAPGDEAARLTEAAHQAVRLSGTELVLYDGDFHEHVDFTWTFDLVHDGAAVLESAIPGADVADQVFRISFADGEDLVRRLVAIIHSRLHRIRYAWPYSDKTPIVIRDLADSVADGSTVKVQRIHWTSPERNGFRAGPLFDARVRNAGFYRYELTADGLPRAVADFDALSNVSYRVLLLRTTEERPLFRVLTVALVLLLLIAAVTAAVSLFRPAEPEDPSSSVISGGRT